jgi:uncharacterized protein (TIGR02687 family)
MYEKIRHAVEAHLNKHRLVFWYDEGGKHRSVVDELDTPADIVQIENNEWWIKYHVLKEKPASHFLVYAPYQRPADRENWLLDLVLAGFSFSHDLSETYREELGLGPEFRTFIADHVEFLQNARERFEPLAELVDPDTETIDTLSVKMIGVVTAPDAEARRLPRPFSRSFFTLAEEALSGGSVTWEALVKYGLSDAFRREVGRYVSATTHDLNPDGAAIALLREAWHFERSGETSTQARSARVLLHEWREEYSAEGRYRAIIKAGEHALNVRAQLHDTTVDALSRLELFPAVDSELASRLVAEAAAEAADRTHIRAIASKRKESYWIRTGMPEVRAVYTFLIRHADFLEQMNRADLTASSADELVDRYTASLFRVDQLHRQCLAAYRAAGSPGTLTPIIDRIDGLYVHRFLQPLAEAWDALRTKDEEIVPVALRSQRRFFDSIVAPFLKRGDKLVVIVSDALRYEVGKELEERVSGMNRLSATSAAMLAVSPSVTAMGMNALLPHRKLSVRADGTVLVDDRSVAGIKGRSSFLTDVVTELFPDKRAGAFWARDINALPTTAARERINGLDIIYLYSDGIDAIGDDAKTETSLPDAVDGELALLTTVIKKFAGNLNRTHILVTADHGFIYQNSPPDDAHLIAAEAPSDGYKDRRYMTGSSGPGAHFRTFTPQQLGIDAPHPFYFADGLYRIRRQGGGIRYVHGGMSVQELVIPLVHVRVGRTDDVRPVGVAVLKAAKAVITTPEHQVVLFQEEPVSEKVQPVTLRATFAANDGTLLSDSAELTFDSPDANAQNRSRTVLLHFAPSAVRYNGTQIVLRLERLIGGAPVPYSEETYLYQTFGERDF